MTWSENARLEAPFDLYSHPTGVSGLRRRRQAPPTPPPPPVIVPGTGPEPFQSWLISRALLESGVGGRKVWERACHSGSVASGDRASSQLRSHPSVRVEERLHEEAQLQQEAHGRETGRAHYTHGFSQQPHINSN